MTVRSKPVPWSPSITPSAKAHHDPGRDSAGSRRITLNAGAEQISLIVANTGRFRWHHYHFAEANPALDFDRQSARGMRLDIAAGTAVRFEPGQQREVLLVPLSGARLVYGFSQQIMGAL